MRINRWQVNKAAFTKIKKCSEKYLSDHKGSQILLTLTYFKENSKRSYVQDYLLRTRNYEVVRSWKKVKRV